MTFKQKVALLPAVASAFLLLILLLSVLFEQDTAQVFERVEQGYAPAMRVARSLELHTGILHAQVREQLADPRPGRLAQLNQREHEMELELALLRRSVVVPAGQLKALEATLDTYWGRARPLLEQAERGELSLTEAEADLEGPAEELRRVLHELGLASQHDMEAAMEQVQRVRRLRQGWVASLAVLCMLVLTALALWLVRQVTRPLTHLADVAARVAIEGDLSQPVEVPAVDDEIGRLARTFDALLLRLRELPVFLHNTLDELGRAAEQLRLASQGQLDFLTHQSRTLSEVGTTMSQIAHTSSLAAERAAMMTKVAARADDVSAVGRQSAESSVAGLEQIRLRVEALVSGVARLSEQAARAGEIIGSVRDLADQSNVLALNASIEAARAGDEGRGFAVVAREIRALSGQSLQSTQRINQILLEINQAVREAVSITEGDTFKLEHNMQQVLASAERLGNVSSVLEESAETARQLSASVRQQGEGIAQMTEGITSLSQMMADVAEMTNSARHAVEQVGHTLERLRELATTFRL